MDQGGRDFLNTPGPTHIPDRVLNAMRRQAMDLVDPRFVAIVGSCFADLKGVFKTEGSIYIYTSNGHGGWEAALANLFEPGDIVLVPETGVFSNAWADHATMMGLEPRLVPGGWRHAIDPQAVEQALREDGKQEIKAVLAVHTDTATGITSDLASVRAAMDAAGHPALLVADVIASLAATPFEMDAWGIDVAIGASQKALMGPPGLAILAVNGKAREHARAVSTHKRYWDWDFRDSHEIYRRFCGTPPEHNIFALREALDMIAEQGLERIFRRHARLAGAVHRAVEVWAEGGALSINALDPKDRSVSVTTIRVPPDMNSETIRVHARQKLGVSLAGGLGELEGKAFRIGHLGDLNEPMILGCLGGVETTLIELSVPHGSGGLRAATEFFAEARRVEAEETDAGAPQSRWGSAAS